VRLQGQIIFIGGFLFPEGDGAAIRTLSLARICRDLGFTVTVIGKGSVRSEDYDKDRGGYYIEGIRYSTMNPDRVSMFQRLRHPIRRLELFASTLEMMNLKNTRAIVINACDSAMHVPMVSAFCQRHSIPLVGDICEWYDPCQMRFGRLNPAYWIFQLMFHLFFPGFKNVIVVSQYLERHFMAPGRNMIRIAAPMDLGTVHCVDRTPQDRLVLLYAGSPGRKDLLREVLEALALLTTQERQRIEFRLLGLNKQKLAEILGESADLLKVLGETVKPLGRVPRDQVLVALQEAHFTVLLRPDKRYANAGFPSKVAESLTAGTPVMLNFTSDLKEYLGDGIAALPVHDCSPTGVAGAIRRALELTPAELLELRRGARTKSEQHFDYRLFVDPFRRFLEQLR